MIVSITHPNQLLKFIPEINGLFEDYLRRSGEPYTLAAQSVAILRVLADLDRHLFLVAFDQRIRPVGYAIAQIGFDFWGVQYCHVAQTYVRPGQPGIAKDIQAAVAEWAASRGCQALSFITRRDTKAFIRRFGSVPVGIAHIIPLSKEQADEQGRSADLAPVDANHPD